ncbi:unknown [Clostridium sp. CAG:354]|jgi:hypothetical protein|nr:hypothetical protein [Clostridium sp.]MEE0269231.1 hypothetical protein [Clostridia bacterium]CDE10113.1 unknown [Clostridium sp. CAG:354]
MKKIKENELGKIIKDNFNTKTILLELNGIIEGHISIINAISYYKNKERILNIIDLCNNIRIDMASQYEIIFDENNKKLEVKLDNGQNLKITVINKKDTL